MSLGAVEGLAFLLDGLQLIEHELLLFAAFWFIVGALDELAVDICWLWLRLTKRLREPRVPTGREQQLMSGRIAVLVPAWHEAEVIGAMVRHTLDAWPQPQMTLFLGCYRNDPDTQAAAKAGAAGDPRVRIVVLDRPGPTTKADCLNGLYAALCTEEARSGTEFAGVVLHDAEDMVHPDALGVIDRALRKVTFVQLPVRPKPQMTSQFVAGHYSDEFAEAHAKSLVVRDALRAAIPAAGVGCGFARGALAKLSDDRLAEGEEGPFSPECLTEDYELGLLVSGRAGRGRFLRMRDGAGELVATRAFFPAELDQAIRQKSRWIHGIAFQSWDRLGWSGRPIDMWMALRDRRGPLTAIVLALAYSLIIVEGILAMGRLAGWGDAISPSPLLRMMVGITFASFVWRALWRFGFTASEYGIVEGLIAVLRIPVANFIAIMAGRRALFAYFRTLGGANPSWEKTAHNHHPAAAEIQMQAR